MTIESMLWPNTGIGDGDVLGYSAARTQDMFRRTSTTVTAVGVYLGFEQECLCEVTALNEVTVRNGVGLVAGIFCIIDEEALVVSSEASATAFVVLIRINTVSQTGGLAVVKSAVGEVNALPGTNTLTEVVLCGGVIETDGTITKALSYNEGAGTRYDGLIDLRRFIGDTSGDRILDWSVGASTSATQSIAILHPFIPQCYDDLQVRLCITTGENNIGLAFNRGNETFAYRYSLFGLGKTGASGNPTSVGVGGSVSSVPNLSAVTIVSPGISTISGELFIIINIYGYNKLGQSKRGDWLCYGNRTIVKGEFTWGSDWSINDIFITGSPITINSSVLLGIRR